MYRSILAVSEGGPDGEMAFRTARRVATAWNGAVDALHLPAEPTTSLLGLSSSRNPGKDDAAAAQSQQTYDAILASLPAATYTPRTNLSRADTLLALGRFSDIVVLGRPGYDPGTTDRAAVNIAIFECGRPVLIAPPRPVDGPFNSVLVAWNGTLEATRAVEYAMPFILAAQQVSIVVVGRPLDEVGAPLLARNFQRHGLKPTIAQINPGSVSGRARGRAILNHARETGAELLVTGAYGGGKLNKFLGLGSATGKVISSSPIPVLMGH